jgi:hypothetical protein
MGRIGRSIRRLCRGGLFRGFTKGVSVGMCRLGGIMEGEWIVYR